MDTVFYNCNVILPDCILKEGAIWVKDGKIKWVGMEKEIPAKAMDCYHKDCQGRYLAPGFIDVHTHGGGGGSFMKPDIEQYKRALTTHLLHGTTTILPTILINNAAEMQQFVKIKKHMDSEKTIPLIPGFFIEGPYTSTNPEVSGIGKNMKQRKPDYVDIDMVRQILDVSENSIRKWMIAPELDGGLEFGRIMRENGIIACMGHSAATYEQADKAKRNGFSCITHLYSAMSTVTREYGFRRGGLVETALLDNELEAEIICDGCHLPPELIRLAVKCKGYDKVMLVSDSGPFAGGAFSGEQEMLGMKIIIEDGVAKLADRSCFAGSIACGDRLVKTAYKMAGLPLWAAVRMVTKTPARHLKLEGIKGEICVGADADINLFDEDVNVCETYVKGNKII